MFGDTWEPRRRALAYGVAAFLIGVPVGTAVAGEVGGSDPPAQAVPAQDCAAEVSEAFDRAGLARDYFVPDCPTAAEAHDQAAYFNEERRRGLTKIAVSIEQYGDASDADQLRAIDAELEFLGGRWEPDAGGSGE